MALTLAKFMILNRSNKLSSLNFFKQVSNKNAKSSSFTLTIKNYSSSIEPQIDKFIPLSSRNLYKKLIEENDSLGGSVEFENVAKDVETTIAKQSLNILPELKFLYNPLDPDLSSTGDLTTSELDDRHFWFLHRLSSILSSGGFEEIIEARALLKGGVVGQGVVVDCNTDHYDILRVWAYGGQRNPTTNPSTPSSFSDSLFNKAFSWRHPKRVVVVRRERGGRKVDVRLFKGVTNPSLLLPPSGSLRMHPTYKKIILTSSTLSLLFLYSRPSLSWLLSTDHLGSAPMAFAGAFGSLGLLLWAGFKHAQKEHLEKVVGTMYDGVVGRNGGCLEMLVDKSQEELLKGVLLSCHFLSIKAKEQDGSVMALPELEAVVEEWVRGKTGGVAVRIPLEGTIKWMADSSLVHHDTHTNNITLLPHANLSNTSRATNLFNNHLSDTNDSTPITTTLKQHIRKD